MSVTIGNLTVSLLRAQPVGYDETDIVNGLVARRWTVDGLLKPSEWLSLLTIFENWRNNRIKDQDTRVSLTVGTTVTFSGSALGYSWTNVACWFASAPQGEASGSYVAASFELIDAQQALAVLVRQREIEVEVTDDTTVNYGTYTLGSATLTLTEQPDGYAEGPQLQRAASGNLLVNGPLKSVKAKRIAGYTTLTGWNAVRSWYETITNRSPITGEYYPASPPEMSQEIVVKDGVKTTRYNVTVELWEVA